MEFTNIGMLALAPSSPLIHFLKPQCKFSKLLNWCLELVMEWKEAKKLKTQARSDSGGRQ